jgi:hypothetical protein
MSKSGGVHAAAHFQPQGISGIGQTTGEKYQGTGVTQDEFNARIGVEETFVNNFRARPALPEKAAAPQAWGDFPTPVIYIFDTVLLPAFTTQMLAPSNATPWGETPPAGKIASTAPSLARSLVTLLA